MLLSVVIPVYNEEAYIKKTLEEVMGAEIGALKKEIIVVNDGSTDHTLSEIYACVKKFSSKKARIVVVNKKKNSGKGAALKKGFLQTKGDIVLVQDADLEYSPDDYPRLIGPIINNTADVVYGSRFISNRPHRVLYFWHSIGNNFLTLFSNMLTNLNLTDMETGYKVFRGDLIRKIARNLQSKKFGFEPEITARLAKIPNIAIYEVGISYRGRTYAEGKKIGWKDGMRAIYEIIHFNMFSK